MSIFVLKQWGCDLRSEAQLHASDADLVVCTQLSVCLLLAQAPGWMGVGLESANTAILASGFETSNVDLQL